MNKRFVLVHQFRPTPDNLNALVHQVHPIPDNLSALPHQFNWIPDTLCDLIITYLDKQS
jgi:hypothetical protein